MLLGRYRWCNRNLYEKYFNNTLAFLLAAQILREHLVQNMLVGTSFMTMPGTWQLGTAVLSYSFAEFIGFSLLWSGMSEAETRRKHRYYRLAGIIFGIGLLICGTRARISEQPLEFTDGWQSLTTLTCSTTMLTVLALRVIWSSLRELRIATRRRERLIALSTLAMGLSGVVNVAQEAALQISDQLGWTHTATYRQQFHSVGLFYAISVVFATAAVPLAMKLLAALGRDPLTRSWCKLQPLRHAMRTVAPECVFDHDDGPSLRKYELHLHQTVVEIRDAILRLRPYSREIPDHDLNRFLHGPNAIPAREHDAAIAALRLAHCARAKAAGITPEPIHLDSAPIVTSRAATLEEETSELITLARWWPAAYAAAESATKYAANTKASPAT